MNEDGVFWTLMVAFLISVFAACYAFESWSCGARWSDSGFESRYGMATGCKINVEGRWIPEDRYREVKE